MPRGPKGEKRMSWWGELMYALYSVDEELAEMEAPPPINLNRK